MQKRDRVVCPHINEPVWGFPRSPHRGSDSNGAKSHVKGRSWDRPRRVIAKVECSPTIRRKSSRFRASRSEAMNDHGIGLPDEGNQALQLRMLETELKELVTSDDKSKVA